MKILGIDPGIGRCGWGVVEAQGQKLKAVKYGCIETSPQTDTPIRLKEVYEKINDIINTFSPDEMSIEELFFNTNAKTAFIVGQARGVILLAAAKNNIPVHTYTPLQVKIALTGYGRAEKNQIGKMVKALLFLDEIPKPDDTTDALAVSMAHIFSNKIGKLK